MFDYVLNKIYGEILTFRNLYRRFQNPRYVAKFTTEGVNTSSVAKEFPLAVFVKIGRTMSQENIYFTEEHDYIILHKKN